MSLLNVVLDTDRARVYVDTAAGSPASDQPGATELAKVLPILVPNCVLAGRGNPAFLSLLAMAMHMAAARDFDELAANLVAMASTVREQYLRAVAIVAPGLAAEVQELALVGWSPSRRRMAAVMCFLDVDALEAECIELPPCGDWLGPWEWGADPPVPIDDAGAYALAVEQVQRGRAAWSRVNLGGRLLAATITRDAVMVQQLGSL